MRDTARAVLYVIAAALIATAFMIFAAAPAHASTPDPGPVFAYAQSTDGARVNLHQAKGPCEGEARFAQHIAPDGAKTSGCWVLTEGLVLVSFLDGERGNIPVGHLRHPDRS